MELWIDKVKISNPTEETIASGFNSITGKSAASAGISTVQLFRDDQSQLTISGHPKDGWMMPGFEENGREFACFDDKYLSQEEVIALFQAYYRGDESWKTQFRWEEQPKINPRRTFRNITCMLLIGATVALFLSNC